MATLQFAPWSSDIEVAFYSSLASRKINHDKLDDAARKVLGRYEIRPQDPQERSARMQIHANAFSTDELPSDHYRAEGILKNLNTIEEYRALDRSAIIDQAARTVWDAIVDGTIYSCPSLLASFHAIFFADLKKYKFTYHFAFPALHSSPAWKFAEDDKNARTKLEPQESKQLYEAVQTWRYSVDPRQHGFFLAKRDRSQATQLAARAEETSLNDDKQTSDAPSAPSIGFQWVIASISAYESDFFADADPSDRFVCFADPSTYPDNPGWPLRNLLVLIKHRWQLSDVQILCYRDKHNTREHPNSLVLHLTSPSSIFPTTSPSSTSTSLNIASESALKELTMPKVTGWERNPNNKLASQTTDLSSYLDPTKLADQAVDLNLKLMKWRVAPSLDLATIQSTKCLLLGAGTLGSYVARNLLGWGVRHITFVDNGTVSFSNPVRQPLFRFEDCVGGGRPKAERAAEALREIYPGVRSEGLQLSVPMAGHPIVGADGEARVRAEYERLLQLIQEHDVIFLLMDTRESRWLPTVLGKALRKPVINAALGFDTYVVMRHGTSGPPPRPESPVSSASQLPTSRAGSPTKARKEEPQHDDSGEELGCYFCTDVVAPADSMTDRTLDQQCTVTRPGIAAIASALSVELLVSLLQHPLRSRAPAPHSRSSERDTFTLNNEQVQHPLGLVPHSIRGFLGSWDNILTKGPAYSACSACSPGIVGRYEKEGWAFVKRAIAEKGWIEEVSGLAEVQRRAEEAARMLEEEEEFEEEGEGELL